MTVQNANVAHSVWSNLWFLLSVLALLEQGCATAREPSKTPRTAIEQLLLSHAVLRSLADLAVPLPAGSSVFVEVVGFSTEPVVLQTAGTAERRQPGARGGPTMIYGPSSDLLLVRDLLAGRLGQLGLRVQMREEDATYRVRMLVRALGTEQGENFFGMPPVQSVLLPFSLPELTLFRAYRQLAHVRYSLDIFEVGSGQLVRSTPWYTGSAYYNQYTVFFFIMFRSSDLIAPP